MNGISILMYHQVGAFAPMRTHRATYCDHRRFAAQMRLLKALDYRVLSMDEVVACLGGQRPIPPRAVALTFDDGYENFYEHAFPILQQYGFPAMVYLVAGKIGGHADWLAAEGHPPAALMDWPRIRELRAAGIDFGSHGMRHIRLANQPPEVLRHELADSRERLQDGLGEAVHHFCYPYGSHDLACLYTAAEAGYQSAVTCQRGRATAGFDPLALPRKAIAFGDDLLGFFWKLAVKHAPKGTALHRTEHPKPCITSPR